MKQHTSVLALWARRTLPLTLLVTAVTAAVQMGSFAWTLNSQAWTAAPVQYLNFSQIVDQSRLTVFFRMGLMLVCGSVLRPAIQRGKWRYTIRRLRVREEASILWYALAALICFLVYWAAETAVCLGLVRWAAAVSGEKWVSGQTAFLLFQSVPFFQSLLPVTGALILARNIGIFLALSLGAAMAYWHEKWGLACVWACIFFSYWIVEELNRVGRAIVALTAAMLYLLVAAATLVGTWRGGGNERADL